MKKLMISRWIFLPFLLGIMISTTLKCTHEDEVLQDIIDSTYEYGNDIVSADDGYTFDKTHSSVRWETAYFGVGALLTGRFNTFGMEIEFDENNPENTTLSGYVVTSSVNTGEPGRDQGCLMGTFGTTVDGTEEATFTSTSVEKDGQGGYNVTGDFSFHGFDGTITGKLTYVGTTTFEPGTPIGGTNGRTVAGFIMEFDILAKSDYGIVSNSIADKVHVICSAQFRKTP